MNDYWESDCEFCQLISQGVPPERLEAQYRHSLVIRPERPVTLGHILVISRLHVPDFGSDPDVTEKVMGDAAFHARYIGDCNLITSRGLAARQEVRHLYVHIIPRLYGDGLGHVSGGGSDE